MSAARCYKSLFPTDFLLSPSAVRHVTYNIDVQYIDVQYSGFPQRETWSKSNVREAVQQTKSVCYRIFHCCRFEFNCTSVNQPQSSNIFMYLINCVNCNNLVSFIYLEWNTSLNSMTPCAVKARYCKERLFFIVVLTFNIK